jgi:hypothetical protein
VLVEFELDGWHTVATPIAAGRAVAGWLAVTSRRGRAADRLTRPAARATAPVLAALARIGGLAREEERAVRAAVLEQLLRPVPEEEAGALAVRAASLGIDLSVPAYVVLIRARRDLDALYARLAQRLGEAGLAHLVAQRPGAIVAIAQGGHERLRAAVAGLVDEHPRIAAGIGRPVTELAAVRHSLRDAEIGVQRVVQRPDGRLLDFADFDLGTRVVGLGAPRQKSSLCVGCSRQAARARSYRRVVSLLACRAASWTATSGTPRSSSNVTNVWRSLCGCTPSTWPSPSPTRPACCATSPRSR